MFIRAYFTEGLSEELSLGIGIRSAWFVDETGALPQPPHQVPLGFWWEQKYPIQHLMIPERGNTRLARWPTCQTVFCTSVVWFPLFCLCGCCSEVPSLPVTQSTSPSPHQNCHFQTHRWNACPPDYSSAWTPGRSLHRPGNKIHLMSETWRRARKRNCMQIGRKGEGCCVFSIAQQHAHPCITTNY